MLIATQAKSVHGTQQYFDQVLTQGDYYLGQEINGRWHGRGAAILGLEEGQDVTRDQFSDLLKGNHPSTGKRLTQRNRRDRRPGMDLTFSVPKSVSLAWAINEDERVIEVLRDAVNECMQRDVEPLMQRRVRDGEKSNTQHKAETGKLIYADFLHKTSRPVDGRPDPHLHVHAFVINWTEQDGKHFAGEFEEIVRQRPSLQAKFEARLARKLKHDLGYDVKHTRYAQSGRIKAGWEINGIDRSTIEKFSRRTEQVEKYALENGVNNAADKATIGKKTREKKDSKIPLDELRKEWQSRLSETERGDFGAVGNKSRTTDLALEEEQARKSVEYALEHHLYRQSTVERHQVIGTALEHGLTLSPESIEASLDARNIIERSIEDRGTHRSFITTREVLAAEKQMIDFARDGRGTRKAIGTEEHEFTRDWLNDQQKAAVVSVLASRDTVMAVTGGAGTGKSSLLQEAAEAIESNGKRVFTFAPSTGAKEVLEEKGFDRAETVEHLIRNEKMHAAVAGQVMWIDEAGLLDVRSINAIFEIAKEQDARVILSGDTRQHASPRRGEAMRLLEREAGLHVAKVEAIQRQKGQYRGAVELISKGHEIVDERTGKSGLLAGFDRLDEMGKIKEVGEEERLELLAEAYLGSIENKKSSLVVAPTHAEANAVTEKIRTSLKETGRLTGDERSFQQLRSLNLTDAEKREAMTYADQKGSVIQFHQNAKGGFKKGDRFRIAGAAGNQVRVSAMDGSGSRQLPLDVSNRFDIYQEQELKLCVGDKVRFSLGGKAMDGNKRISNGRMDEITGFDKTGNPVLERGTVIDKDYGHLGLGYVVTSHASQGKDRHVAIAAMSSQSLPAINAKQFYVTVSRGSEDVMLFVDDKSRIRRAIERSGEQMAATELVKARPDNRECDTTTDRGNEVFRQGQQLVRSFRDRVVNWWINRNEAHHQNEHVGRHREAQAGRDLSKDFTRSLGRGPELGGSF